MASLPAAPAAPGRRSGTDCAAAGGVPGVRVTAFPRPGSLHSEIPEQKALELRVRLSRGEIQGLPAPQVRHLVTSRPATKPQSPLICCSPRAPAKAAGETSKDFIKSSKRLHCKPTALAIKDQAPGSKSVLVSVGDQIPRGSRCCASFQRAAESPSASPVVTPFVCPVEIPNHRCS